MPKSSPWLTKIQFLWVSNCIIEGIDSWRGIKMQKSICFHVCVNKKGLVRHAIVPRTLLDAHGPKEVSESKQYDLTTHRKIFRASQSQRLDSLKSNFLSPKLPYGGNWLLQGYQNAKNRCVFTFASIKKDWYVMRSPRALCWMRTVPKKSLKANSII